MRYLIAVLITFFFVDKSIGQNEISWKGNVKQESENIYVINFEAKLAKGWHLYSQQEAEDPDAISPTPTEFTFNSTPETYELIGETKEPEGIEKYDNIFEMDVKSVSYTHLTLPTNREV